MTAIAFERALIVEDLEEPREWLADLLPRERSDSKLTDREVDVLRLIAKGYRATEVAPLLGLSANTVSSYVRDIYRKLGISSRAEAAMEAARRGLVA